jgi:hypothetical protein
MSLLSPPNTFILASSKLLLLWTVPHYSPLPSTTDDATIFIIVIAAIITASDC